MKSVIVCLSAIATLCAATPSLAQSTNWSLPFNFDDQNEATAPATAADRANALLAEDDATTKSKLEFYRIPPAETGSPGTLNASPGQGLQSWQLQESKTTGINEQGGIGFKFKSD